MRFRRLLLACTLGVSLAGAGTLEEAAALVEAHRYPEALQMLEPLVAAEPTNAAACHYLGRALVARNDSTSLEEGLTWLQRAVNLKPDDARYLGSFGASSLQLASRTNSLSRATQGRDALEKAVSLDAGQLDAREALFLFYQRAPWPLGSRAKAAVHLEEIRRRNPDLGTVLDVTTKVTAKDFAAAFQQCDAVLARSPENYVALYHYGRTASICGENLSTGLSHLQKCLTLPPPTAASPTHSHVWHRIGVVRERLHEPGEARAAYAEAVRIDPSNRQAAEALARLAPPP